MRRNLGEQTVAFRFCSQLLRLLHIVFGWGYFPFRRGRKGNKFLFHLQPFLHISQQYIISQSLVSMLHR